MRVDVEVLMIAAADAYAAAGSPASTAAADLLRSLSGKTVDTKPKLVPPALDSALAAMPLSGLRDLLRENAPGLPWTSVEGPLAGRLAAAEIAGPDGLLQQESLRIGVFLQSPETLYPVHSHAAEELYLVLSGKPLWQKDAGSFTPVAPGAAVHHLSYQHHAMKTEREAFLALWLWTGDLSFESYRFHEIV